MGLRHAVRAGCAIGALAAVFGACETARNPGGVQRDQVPPAITLTVPQDTQPIASGLQFTVDAADNLGLKEIRVTFSDTSIAPSDTVFTTTVTSYSKGEVIKFSPTSGAGGNITITARATDGAGNFTDATIVVFLSNVQALNVTLVQPVAPASASVGLSLPVKVRAQQIGGLQRVGYIVSPGNKVTLPADSLVFAGALPTDTTYTNTITVAAGASGTFTVTGFAADASGRRVPTSAVTVTILTAANDVTAPTVSHTIAARVEATDSVRVHATDPSGIAWIGFRVDTVLSAAPPFTGITPARFDSADVQAARLTVQDTAFSLGLSALPSFPRSVVVRGYACDLANSRNCAYSQTSTLITPTAPRGPVRAATPSNGIDTVVVVAGRTFVLPVGGKIADAIFNANLNELYLTNSTRHRVEIFRVGPDSFVPAGITFGVGVPWGIALWPRNTLGQVGSYGDTIVVADAGGTQLAIVDVRPTVRQLQWRQDLPNFLIETYKILTTQGAGTIEEIRIHDVSDRPQYVATVCRTGGGTTCPQDSIFALYSTTPTVSSSSPLSGKATLRMEKLVSPASALPPFSKLFWEIASTTSTLTNDTLRIELIRGNTSTVVLSACAGVSVKLDEFGLGDSTYARNSGDFTHAFFGEGGNITTGFARVMAYRTSGLLTQTVNNSCVGVGNRSALAGGTDVVDLGMSAGVNVSDFISNTGIHVSSIATNLNGLTNVVRADSIYYLDEFLRLKATSCTLASDLATCVTGTPGMDMNYLHDFSPGGGCTPTCGGGTNTSNRLLFAARPDASIDVFDTYDGGQLLSGGTPVTIPIRDPIIGPFRVARDATGQLLFGITAKGLVMVRLPTLTNPNPAPPRR